MNNGSDYLKLRVWICLSFFVLTGCGGSSTHAPVQGTVTLDGKPIQDATVSFVPSDGGRPALGTTDASGTYQLKGQDAEGAKIGQNRVAIVAVETVGKLNTEKYQEGFGSLAGMGPGERQQRKRWIIPKPYSNPKTSGLTFTVEPGSNQADFALKLPRKKRR